MTLTLRRDTRIVLLLFVAVALLCISLFWRPRVGGRDETSEAADFSRAIACIRHYYKEKGELPWRLNDLNIYIDLEAPDTRRIVSRWVNLVYERCTSSSFAMVYASKGPEAYKRSPCDSIDKEGGAASLLSGDNPMAAVGNADTTGLLRIRWKYR
jgi:hypothetical protein